MDREHSETEAVADDKAEHDDTEELLLEKGVMSVAWRYFGFKRLDVDRYVQKYEVTMKEVGKSTQLRAGEMIIIVVVLIMWAGVIALFCRQYDIIKDNEPNNNKDKAKNSSECSTPEHPTGGLLRSKV
ncbi:FNDC5 protein, partial [Polypterus senegalus]